MTDTTTTTLLNPPFTDATPENLSTICSLVSKRQHENTRLGIAPRDARRMAAEDIGSMLKPPMGAKELEQWMGQQKANIRRANHAAIVKEFKGPDRKTKPAPEHVTAKDRYTAWVESNDTVANDEQVAFFMDITAGAISYARAELRKAGWEFERLEKSTGWRVMSRPVTEPTLDLSGFTPAQIRTLANLVKQLKGTSK